MIIGSFYTLGEAATKLGKHRNTVARWIKEGRFPVTQLGNVVLIRQEDVERGEGRGPLAQREDL